MKAVLISIKPKWCELIASGEKTVEVRKNRPKLETPFKCYIYCTKDNTDLVPSRIWWKADKTGFQHILNGKVIGEFVCDFIEPWNHSDILEMNSKTGRSILSKFSCVPFQELLTYKGELSEIFAWHISNLIIYDKPKELSEFRIDCKGGCDIPYLYAPPCEHCRKDKLTRPPQSWCYVTEAKNV